MIERWATNPFYVLGLAPETTGPEVERVGQRLLAQLELGLGTVATYLSPFGPRARTPDLVRQALADLRDPERRVVAEVWASLPAEGPFPT